MTQARHPREVVDPSSRAATQNPGPSRRSVVGAGLSLAGLGLVGTSVSAPEARADAAHQAGPLGQVRAWPVTNDRVAVVAPLADGQILEVEVEVEAGATRARGVAVGGGVVVGVPVPRSSTTTLRVTLSAGSSRTGGSSWSDALGAWITLPLGERLMTVSTTDDALRGSLLRVVNKRIALGEKDDPKKLTARSGVQVDDQVAGDLEAMIARARKDRIGLEAISGYRAFAYQKKVYEDYAKRDGAAAADTYSARPGHSEHQLGLAVDVRGGDGAQELQEGFKNTPAGRWVATHGHEFGFIVRYPAGGEKLTGYHPEPWHLRYIGRTAAAHLRARGDVDTLEQLLGLPARPGTEPPTSASVQGAVGAVGERQRGVDERQVAEGLRQVAHELA